MSDTTVNTLIRKAPEVNLLFWITKIFATTLGETGGDSLSMSMNLGYVVSTLIFASLFIIFVILQVRSQKFNLVLYWLTIIATTTVGTTFADFVDRDLGIGYPGGSTILFILLMTSLFLWYKTAGKLSIDLFENKKAEVFYWVTILFSQTLGTALGDWFAGRFGYGKSAIIFSILLLILAMLYYRTTIARTTLFWSAFILTRPLGATLGDFLDKPLADGGLNLSRYAASLVLIVLIAMCLIISSRRKSKKAKIPHQKSS